MLHRCNLKNAEVLSYWRKKGDEGRKRNHYQSEALREFGHQEEENAREGVTGEDPAFTTVISREAYANIYGPTTGDKIRLGDTNLYAEIEKDYAIHGDECVFGGGKVIRDGMGQSCGHRPADSLDTAITNATIVDYTGIYKADIGIKDNVDVTRRKF
ncbi:urease [Euphorbia peplus]|nr:urease [Euphorbia peplus]